MPFSETTPVQHARVAIAMMRSLADDCPEYASEPDSYIPALWSDVFTHGMLAHCRAAGALDLAAELGRYADGPTPALAPSSAGWQGFWGRAASDLSAATIILASLYLDEV